MNKMFYPAIFHEAEEGVYWVSFPDFPECLTQGNDIEETYRMAYEALGLTLSERKKEHEAIPSPSRPCDISVKMDDSIVLIEFDMAEYLKKHSNKAVKKTLTIPEWLNKEALDAGINFSQVLQEALMIKLGH